VNIFRQFISKIQSCHDYVITEWQFHRSKQPSCRQRQALRDNDTLPRRGVSPSDPLEIRLLLRYWREERQRTGKKFQLPVLHLSNTVLSTQLPEMDTTPFSFRPRQFVRDEIEILVSLGYGIKTKRALLISCNLNDARQPCPIKNFKLQLVRKVTVSFN